VILELLASITRLVVLTFRPGMNLTPGQGLFPHRVFDPSCDESITETNDHLHYQTAAHRYSANNMFWP